MQDQVRPAKASDSISWIFLGRDYSQLSRWEAGLGAGFTKVSYSEQLQATGLSLRQKYLDWIGEFGRKDGSIAWWTSHIAERNTMGESLFHSICYVRVGAEVVRGADGPLLVVAESPAVLDSIADHQEIRSRIRRRSQASALVGIGPWLAKFVYRWLRYLLDSVLAMSDARRTRGARQKSPSTQRPRALIRSCIDDTYFGADGARERYMPGLAEMIESQGYEVAILPWLCNVTKNRAKAFRWFRSQPTEYLIPDDYYHLSDYLWAGWIIASQLSLPRSASSFDGMKVGNLVCEEQRRQAADPSRAQFVLYYRLIRRLKEAGHNVDLFVDMFENLASEKPSLMGFRRWMPNTLTVGYQHYLSMYPLLLSLFTSKAEVENAPHPDVLVAGSDLGAEQLELVGFPKAKIRRGPTLRYQRLLANLSRSSAREKVVVVVIPQEILAAEELLAKVFAAFADPLEVPLVVKMHPMLPEGALDGFFGRHPMPSHFRAVDGSMEEWLGRAACVVTMAGSTAFEVALKAIPVVVVGRETDFNFDALGWFSEFPDPVTSASALRQRVEEQIALSPDAQSRLEAWAAKMLPRAVTRIDASDSSVFVEGRALALQQ